MSSYVVRTRATDSLALHTAMGETVIQLNKGSNIQAAI